VIDTLRALSCRASLLALLLGAGCAASGVSADRENAPAFSAGARQTGVGEDDDVERLRELYLRRLQENITADYPVGPGDLIEVSVPAIDELRDRTVRVAGDGTFSLPFVGKTQAAGLTEEELKQKLTEQLKQYMYSPRVIVFVKEYRSRQVAVLGAVGRPGVYNLSTGADTIMDMLSLAGGIAPAADPKIYLMPAEPVDKAKSAQIVATLPSHVVLQDPALRILKRTEPIMIDVKQLSFGGNHQYLSLQVRPGDVIMVPGGGQVLVEGWVEKPGAYPMTPGLTVVGAVAAAGGKMYPADVNQVKVVRAAKGGTKTVMIADLEKIKRGDAPDVPLEGGDIVEVLAVNSKLIAYGLYRLFSTVVNVGVGGTIPIVK
jgi:polysaccharide export outer membrane protein